MITIEIKGKPIPQARPRFKRSGKTYNPQSEQAKDFATKVLAQYKDDPIDGPIWLRVMFFMLRPKNHYKSRIPGADRIRPGAPLWHAKKPDISNLVKFVEDSLNGVLWEDDSQIIHIEASKSFANAPEDVRTIIKVQRRE